VAAVDLLVKGQYPYMIGIKGNELVHIPLGEVISKQKPISDAYLEIVNRMAI